MLPCGTESARRRHLARVEYCGICGTLGRRVPLVSLHVIVARRRQLQAIRGAA
jgi:hypothetical protein